MDMKAIKFIGLMVFAFLSLMKIGADLLVATILAIAMPCCFYDEL